MKKLLAFALAPILVIAGCTGQNTAAALIGIAGTAVQALIVQSGNTVPANLPQDFAAAQSAVANWKTGSPTLQVDEALNLVITDINLIPVSAQDKAYITLAVGTVEQVLALFPPTTGAVSASVAARPTTLPKDPSKTFKAQWNAITASGQTKTKVVLK